MTGSSPVMTGNGRNTPRIVAETAACWHCLAAILDISLSAMRAIMRDIQSGNVVPLRAGTTLEQMEITARDLVEKHWITIAQASEGEGTAFAPLETEAIAVSEQLNLSPDATEKFNQLILAEVTSHFRRKIAQGIVEDFWRTLVSVARLSHSASESQGKLHEVERTFRARLDQIARRFSPVEASAFREAVEAEDKALALLRQTDRAAFLQRLGLPDDKIASTSGIAQHHQSLGEMAVKTAVRAAVWEGVRALFRAI